VHLHEWSGSVADQLLEVLDLPAVWGAVTDTARPQDGAVLGAEERLLEVRLFGQR
jgi:hypothetical protein